MLHKITHWPEHCRHWRIVVSLQCLPAQNHVYCVSCRFLSWCCLDICNDILVIDLKHWFQWWHYQMETFSMLLALCDGNPPVTGGFPSQRPVTRRFDVFFDLCLNKWLSKQSRRWWFETSSRSLWRHCDTHNYLGQTVESISDILHLCVQMINDGFTLMSEIYLIISCDSCSSTVDAAYSYQDDVMTRRHWTSCWTNIRLTGNLRRHKMHVHIKLYTDMYLRHSP